MIKSVVPSYLNLLKFADALVAADAERFGISKEEAWAGARAAAVIQVGEMREWLLDLADPLGWRAAARAESQAGAIDAG